MEDVTDEEVKYFVQFSRAVEENNEDTISTLIKKNGILEKVFYCQSYSFLHVVAEKGTVKTAKQICDLRININIGEEISEDTPLFCAVKNSAEMVQFLVENGAKVNYLNHRGETALHYAVRYSALKAVEILLQNEANVFLSTKKVTVLQEAIYCASEEIVQIIVNTILSKTQTNLKKVETIEETIKILLENKKMFIIRKEDYPILILFAAKYGNKESFNLVLQDCRNNSDSMEDDFKEVNYKGYEDRTALHYAVREQLPQVVRYLLENGADVNCKTKEKYTPLHYAACVQNEEICKILLSFGAEVDSLSSEIGSPLHQLCIQEGDIEGGYYYSEESVRKQSLSKVNTKIMKILLKSGSDPNVSTREGTTLFQDFCSYDSLEAVKILLEFGVDLNAQDQNGNSALHFAVKHHSLEIVDLLLNKGLDINMRNSKLSTPLLEIRPAISAVDLDMVEYLIDRGADVNARYENGDSLLYSIVKCMALNNYVHCLLELGANVKLKSKNYTEISIHYSILKCKETLIPFLALNETELGDYINSYVGQSQEMLSYVREFFAKSRLEVEKLKIKRIIQETPVSFHDFLTRGYHDAVRYLRNDAIKKIFKSRDYYTEFPCYKSLLEERFQRVLNLKHAVNEMENFLNNILPSIPTLIISKILCFLNSSDFRNFYRNLQQEWARNTEELWLSETLYNKLELNRTYNAIVEEIRETGVMVSLFLNMPNVFVRYLPANDEFHPLNVQVGDMIQVMYCGRYPRSKKIRIIRYF